MAAPVVPPLDPLGAAYLVWHVEHHAEMLAMNADCPAWTVCPR